MCSLYSRRRVIKIIKQPQYAQKHIRTNWRSSNPLTLSWTIDPCETRSTSEVDEEIRVKIALERHVVLLNLVIHVQLSGMVKYVIWLILHGEKTVICCRIEVINGRNHKLHELSALHNLSIEAIGNEQKKSVIVASSAKHWHFEEVVSSEDGIEFIVLLVFQHTFSNFKLANELGPFVLLALKLGVGLVDEAEKVLELRWL